MIVKNHIQKKNGQAWGVIIALSNTSLNAEDLGDALKRVQNAGVDYIKSIIVVDNKAN